VHDAQPLSVARMRKGFDEDGRGPTFASPDRWP
jgi:hypothetical protein